MTSTRKLSRLRQHLKLVENDPSEPHVYVIDSEYDVKGYCVFCEQMVFPFDDLAEEYRQHDCPKHPFP